MKRVTDFLLCIRQTVKLYDQYLEEVRANHHLSKVEITIISFLHNNPGRDTASDIVELRMLPKGNVSQGVESLIQKCLLERIPDRDDRRKIHLVLKPQAFPIVEEIEKACRDFCRQVFAGFSQKDLDCYDSLTDRLMQNTLRGFKGE